MKNIVLILSTFFLLSSAASSYEHEFASCKERFRECTDRQRDLDTCVEQYTRCTGQSKRNTPRCEAIRQKSATHLLSGMTSFPVYIALFPVTLPLSAGTTTEYQECLDLERY